MSYFELEPTKEAIIKVHINSSTFKYLQINQCGFFGLMQSEFLESTWNSSNICFSFNLMSQTVVKASSFKRVKIIMDMDPIFMKSDSIMNANLFNNFCNAFQLKPSIFDVLLVLLELKKWFNSRWFCDIAKVLFAFSHNGWTDWWIAREKIQNDNILMHIANCYEHHDEPELEAFDSALTEVTA